jgi:hypothetical protein
MNNLFFTLDLIEDFEIHVIAVRLDEEIISST